LQSVASFGWDPWTPFTFRVKVPESSPHQAYAPHGKLIKTQVLKSSSRAMNQFMPKICKLLAAMRTSFIESFTGKVRLYREIEILKCVLNLRVREILTAVLAK
jgi:hypothetical protein